MQDACDLFQSVAIRVEVFHAQSKSAKIFRTKIQLMEYWAEGWEEGFSHFGQKKKISLVSGMFLESDPTVGTAIRRCAVILAVHDYDVFCKDLQNIVNAAVVQLS